MKTTKYIGIDVHSSTCSFCVLDSQGAVLENRTLVTNGRLIIEYLLSLGKNVKVAFEECGMSSWLFEILSPHFAKILVCNPVENRQYKRAKTDKIDAYNLANLLRGNYLQAVFHDGSARERLRVLVSGYEDTIRESTRLKNQTKALRRRRRASQDKEDVKFILEQFSGRQKLLAEMIEAYQEKLTEEVKRFKETTYLISMPGIRYLQAARIIACVIDPQRFKNKYKFFAYCGLVRHRRQSGGRDYGTTRIYGNRSLKCVFKMAAHSALRGSESAMRKYYEALRRKGVSEKAAKNAVARKLAAVALALWKNKKSFKEEVILKSLTMKE